MVRTSPADVASRTLDQVGNAMPSWMPSLAAALVMAVGMGFGRFAFTGMYPLMVRDGLLSVSAGSLAASANYAGYLVGALAVSRMPQRAAPRFCRIALVGSALCLLALAVPAAPWFFIGVRFLAGVLSAIALICASVWLFQVVGHPHGAPLLFSGVGAGILLSAELIAAGNLAGWHSPLLWMAIGGGAAILSLPAWPYLGGHAQARQPHAAASATGEANAGGPGPWPLVASYGLAGFGYIVTATYLPLFVRDALGHIDPIHIWAAFGLGAAPSCFLWHALHGRLGTRRALALNLLVQAAGVILPALSHSAVAYLASALLVGGTFVGTVTIAMPAAKRVAHRVTFNLLAIMTAAYGVGQIAGPLVSTALMAHSHSFSGPLAAAAGTLLAAAAFCFL
ncbi:major facilitator transporter [Cupriavidus basilensis OR16]|uniref:Major facilitator transporter n=1 Tax=Cupriavidus basilensis OR16 TaxID=1127483 RepID=H1RYF1_9BURK|nr:YbfB/YjiJ family MFS transporter [Cupriavidus basilensis]EHP44642.1 major facilitator transporter [Cupriavidus basilensis OR16]